MTLESKIDRHFTEKVRRNLNGMVVKLAPTTVGVPDRLVLLPGGRIFLVELKSETGRLTPKQEHWHGLAAEVGTIVTVLHGREEVDQWVSQQSSGKPC